MRAWALNQGEKLKVTCGLPNWCFRHQKKTRGMKPPVSLWESLRPLLSSPCLGEEESLVRPHESIEWKWANVIKIIRWTSVKIYWAALDERDIFHTLIATWLREWKREGHLLHRRGKKKVCEIIYNITHSHYLSQIILMPCLWYWLLCSALNLS